jgi:hypothetical protein
MRASLVDVQRAFRNVEEQLRELGLLMDHNESVVLRLSGNTVRVTWAASSLRPELSRFVDSTVEEYLVFLRGRHFNFLLLDGSMIQMSYDLRGRNEIVGCRAVWFPCPAPFAVEDLEYASIEELVETTPQLNLVCRAPLRIDFAPGMATPDHPSTHLHSGVEKFRLPAQRALEPTRFVRLILRTAYPDLWRGRAETMTCDDWSASDSLTDEDRRVGFLGWMPVGLGPAS